MGPTYPFCFHHLHFFLRNNALIHNSMVTSYVIFCRQRRRTVSDLLASALLFPRTNFQQLTNSPDNSLPVGSLCFHILTHCPICNSFVLISLQQYRGVRTPLPCIVLKFYFNSSDSIHCDSPLIHNELRGTTRHFLPYHGSAIMAVL
jgi:hypothetical protein